MLFLKAFSNGIEGDLKGDGFQNGGALAVNRNGRQLLKYKQKDPSEYVKPSDVFKAFGIERYSVRRRSTFD
jgi:prostamide/prostaglandin F2alpha synthase